MNDNNVKLNGKKLHTITNSKEKLFIAFNPKNDFSTHIKTCKYRNKTVHQ